MDDPLELPDRPMTKNELIVYVAVGMAQEELFPGTLGPRLAQAVAERRAVLAARKAS